MAAIFRDSSAGQLARLFLHLKIKPYEDEKEGFALPQAQIKPSNVPSSAPSRDESPHDDADTDVEKDVEKEGPADETARDSVDRRPVAPTPLQENPNIIGWNGPNDEDNPQNWSRGKKAFVFAQICLLTFSIYSASAIVTPAHGKFIQIFGITQQVSSLSLSMYVLGYGLGPLIFSPMSEMGTVGRNIAYMSSFLIFIVLTAVGCGVSNFPGLIVIRFLQGFFGGPVLATGPASAGDIYPPNKVPYAVSCWAVFGYAGPAIGPLMAGFAVTLSTWRWAFYETLILSGFTFVLLLFCLPETSAEYILSKRAARLRAATGNPELRSAAEAHDNGKDWFKLISYHLTMPFKITILDPSILFINLYTGLVYGIYYSFFESFPLVYMGLYGWSVGVMGIVFLSFIIGAFIALAIYTLLIWYIYEPYTLKYGVGKPEYRLVPGIFAAALAPAGMFIFGYAAREDINWVAPTVGLVLYSGTSFILVNCIFVYLPMSYPKYAASIFAANGVFRSALACGAVHFSQPLFHNLGVGDGCAILGSLTAGCALLFLGLWKIGPSLRKRSRFAENY